MVRFCLENFKCIFGKLEIVEYLDRMLVFKNRGILFCDVCEFELVEFVEVYFKKCNFFLFI